MKNYTIIYTYNHAKFGFQNQITVIASNSIEAIKTAKNKCIETYGQKQINRFSFKCPLFGNY
jgi:hypothetical protein